VVTTRDAPPRLTRLPILGCLRSFRMRIPLRSRTGDSPLHPRRSISTPLAVALTGTKTSNSEGCPACHENTRQRGTRTDNCHAAENPRATVRREFRAALDIAHWRGQSPRHNRGSQNLRVEGDSVLTRLLAGFATVVAVGRPTPAWSASAPPAHHLARRWAGTCRRPPRSCRYAYPARPRSRRSGCVAWGLRRAGVWVESSFLPWTHIHWLPSGNLGKDSIA
jgi:hypothetical protein